MKTVRNLLVYVLLVIGYIGNTQDFAEGYGHYYSPVLKSEILDQLLSLPMLDSIVTDYYDDIIMYGNSYKIELDYNSDGRLYQVSKYRTGWGEPYVDMNFEIEYSEGGFINYITAYFDAGFSLCYYNEYNQLTQYNKYEIIDNGETTDTLLVQSYEQYFDSENNLIESQRKIYRLLSNSEQFIEKTMTDVYEYNADNDLVSKTYIDSLFSPDTALQRLISRSIYSTDISANITHIETETRQLRSYNLYIEGENLSELSYSTDNTLIETYVSYSEGNKWQNNYSLDSHNEGYDLSFNNDTLSFYSYDYECEYYVSGNKIDSIVYIGSENPSPYSSRSFQYDDNGTLVAMTFYFDYYGIEQRLDLIDTDEKKVVFEESYNYQRISEYNQDNLLIGETRKQFDRGVWSEISSIDYYYRVTPEAIGLSLLSNQDLTIEFNYALDTTSAIEDFIDLAYIETESGETALEIESVSINPDNNKLLDIRFNRPLHVGESFEIFSTSDLHFSDGRTGTLSINTTGNDLTKIDEVQQSANTIISQNGSSVKISNPEGINSVQVYSIMGESIDNISFSSRKEATVDISQYAVGTYILQVKLTNGISSFHKVYSQK